MLQQSIVELETWMEDHCTHPGLREYVPIYLAYRGQRDFDSLPGMTNEFSPIAKDQDKIGWRNFTEGKICERLRITQETYLLSCDTMITIDSWMRRFIDQLLSLTHSQWIFRNITKHHSSQHQRNNTVRQARVCV